MESYDEKAMDEYNKLAPFDVIEPPPGICGGISPLPISNEVHGYLVPLCELGLHKYNTEQGTNFVFAEILKSTTQIVAGTNYFITFQAKSPNCPLVTFQTHVWVKLPCYGGQPEVQSCAIKPT